MDFFTFPFPVPGFPNFFYEQSTSSIILIYSVIAMIRDQNFFIINKNGIDRLFKLADFSQKGSFTVKYINAVAIKIGHCHSSFRIECDTEGSF